MLRYLLPHSLDSNPIEPVFSKLKTRLRNAQNRTLKTRLSAIGLLMGRFLPKECERYIRYRGLS